MTVDELIKRLQDISDKGKGEFEVTFDDDSMLATQYAKTIIEDDEEFEVRIVSV